MLTPTARGEGGGVRGGGYFHRRTQVRTGGQLAPPTCNRLATTLSLLTPATPSANILCISEVPAWLKGTVSRTVASPGRQNNLMFTSFPLLRLFVQFLPEWSCDLDCDLSELQRSLMRCRFPPAGASTLASVE